MKRSNQINYSYMDKLPKEVRLLIHRCLFHNSFTPVLRELCNQTQSIKHQLSIDDNHYRIGRCDCKKWMLVTTPKYHIQFCYECEQDLQKSDPYRPPITRS